MSRLLAATLVALVPGGFHASTQVLPSPVRAEVKRTHGHPGCPVPVSDLRLLTVSYHGFNGLSHTGELVVNDAAAAPLARVFHQLYLLHFPIRSSDKTALLWLATRLGKQRASPGARRIPGLQTTRALQDSGNAQERAVQTV